MGFDFEVSEIKVNVSEKKIYFKAGKENLIFDCGIGEKGFAPKGEGVEGDKKTPLGKFKVEFVRKPREGETSVFTVTRNPKRNLGPVFICLDLRYKGKLRGIGIHGSEDGSLSKTEGCIRMRNKDIVNLKDAVKPGTIVVISS